MKEIRLLLAVSAMFCMTHSVSAASMMKVKMAETYLKTAEAGGFTAKSAAKEARQRIDALKKEYGENDPDVQALEKRLLVIENKEKAAQEAAKAAAKPGKVLLRSLLRSSVEIFVLNESEYHFGNDRPLDSTTLGPSSTILVGFNNGRSCNQRHVFLDAESPNQNG